MPHYIKYKNKLYHVENPNKLPYGSGWDNTYGIYMYSRNEISIYSKLAYKSGWDNTYGIYIYSQNKISIYSKLPYKSDWDNTYGIYIYSQNKISIYSKLIKEDVKQKSIFLYYLSIIMLFCILIFYYYKLS